MSKSRLATLCLLAVAAISPASVARSQTVAPSAAPPPVNQAPVASLPAPSPGPQLPSTGTLPTQLPTPEISSSPPTSIAVQAQPSNQPTAPGAVPPDAPKLTDKPINLEPQPAPPPVMSLTNFMGYRYGAGSTAWIPGNGNQFGMFSFGWDHYVEAGIKSGVGIGADFNFLSGPTQTDMPARTYDFSIAYQARDRLGPFGYDVAGSVLAASDFEGSARQGILFPSHAVGFLSVDSQFDLVLGVDYLDRGDVKILPVGGVIWTPRSDMRFEVVFPRPRAVFQLTDRYACYLSGELGGGTWAIERPVVGNDLATYHDLRLCVGLEYLENDKRRSAFEIGYLFDRRIEYSSGIGNMPLDDAVLLRAVTWY
jgi:hypothetical protein